MPYHLLLDHAGEAKLGKLQIGTTRRGIGPCYADKAARLGIRMQDLLDEKILRKKIYAALEPKRLTLRPFAKDPRARPAHDDRGVPHATATGSSRFIADTPPIVWDALDDGGLVVFEGAQGALLDIDHGTYPFVTSSNPVAGRGLRRRRRRARGRSTRSGASPRRTPRASAPGRSRPSSTTSSATHLREAGGEFGTTTGRARRTGWLDLVALRYAARVNGLTGLAVTKLDVLTGIDPLHVGVRYPGPEGARFDDFPYHQSIVHKVQRRLRELPGWHEDIARRRSIDELPANARDYLEFISRLPRRADRDGRRRPGPRRR